MASFVALGAGRRHPKAVTTLGPVTQEPPDVPAPQIVGPQDPAGAAVTAHPPPHPGLLDWDVRVRRDLPDSVHQMRVAARRLRSGLRFSNRCSTSNGLKLCAPVGLDRRELGVSRDTEVLRPVSTITLTTGGRDFAPLIRAVVDPALSERWHDARPALKAMVSQRYREFLDNLVDAARRPRLNSAADAPAQDVLPALVEKAWKKLRKEVKLLELDGEAHPGTRLASGAKKARYAAEAVAPVMGEGTSEVRQGAVGVTEVLGASGRLGRATDAEGVGLGPGDRRNVGFQSRTAARVRVRAGTVRAQRLRRTVAQRQTSAQKARLA